ncbi:F-box domain-containing protein [Mycena sanguinolenta]|uniref:F-box domain-containing protein n=1 Tax=Mycena sanguinolenta TaxID=230812 RepID=A0A8H6YAU4_9AGAR|nr:F-box domain-containing protein [Mycena sanguinolenta]
MDSNQRLRDRLEDIKAQIALLRAEKEMIEEKLHSIKYPVLSLPFELTSEIFFHCLPDLQHADPIFDVSPVRLPAAVLLTQICRTWRAVALKTPRIWAIFRIDVEAWPPDDCSRDALRLGQWAERSGVSPLSFVLNRQRDRPYRPLTPPAILAPILALAKQWQNVNLCLPHIDLVSEQFQSTLHGRLPRLETLQITSDRVSATTVVSAFEMAPSLRRVVLEGLPPTKIFLPWKQLTHFSADAG